MHSWDDRFVNHVSFSGPFEKEGSDHSTPPGKDALDRIATLLRAANVEYEYSGATDYSHEFSIHIADKSINGMLGLADDEGRDWLLCLLPRTGMISRFFRRNNEDASQLAAKAIHNVLKADNAFTSIRWYTAKGWNEDPEDGWKATP